jgi:hypothetical protein
MTVMVAIPTMTVMVVAANGNHNLGVRRLGERCSENKGEQRVQKDFHIYCDSLSTPQVVIRPKHLHGVVTLTPSIKRLV